MQAPKDHSPIKINQFRGLYSRGGMDSTPKGYFIDSLNNKFHQEEVSTRDGTALVVTASNIVRAFSYKRLNETPRIIFLDSSGNLRDSLAPGTPIWTDAAIVDFALVNYNNRAYITVHNRLRGLSGKKLLVYEGTGMVREAAGGPPSGFTITVANSASAGNIEEGIHLFAMVGISSSGFITAPGPEIFAELNAPGGFKVDISGLAVGGGATIGKIVLATKSIPVSLYTGNQFGYEFFFVPGTTIDNATTTVTADFFDDDLLVSADYLFDSLPTIPAGLGIGVYGNRLITWGENGGEFIIRGSEPNHPEVFNSISGYLSLDPSDAGSGIRNCKEYRKNLIIGTSNRLYATSDNGGDVNTWATPTTIDTSCGTECFGIATILDARGQNTDRMWIADKSGLVCFEGYAKRPELSYNIEDLWLRINKLKFNLIQVVDDPVKHRLFISVPLDNSTIISHILYADYSEAFTVYGTIDEKMIKWDLWTFPSEPVSIIGDSDASTQKSSLKLALTAGNIYEMQDGLTGDFGNAINSYVQQYLAQQEQGWVHHFGPVKFSCTGTGNLAVTVAGKDNTELTSIGSIALSANPGREYDKLNNFVNEKMSVKFRTNLFGEKYTVDQVIMSCKPIWYMRPM